MSRVALALLLSLAAADLVAAQTVDKAKLRRLTETPAPAQSLLDPADGASGYWRDPAGVAREIAALEKRLTGGPADAALLLDQSDRYYELGEPAKGTAARDRAHELLRPIVTTPAARGEHFRLYARALPADTPNYGAERLSWARRATVAAPDDWRGWDDLAVFLIHVFTSWGQGSMVGLTPDQGYVG